jgi:hypothetical protein
MRATPLDPAAWREKMAAAAAVNAAVEAGNVKQVSPEQGKGRPGHLLLTCINNNNNASGPPPNAVTP